MVEKIVIGRYKKLRWQGYLVYLHFSNGKTKKEYIGKKFYIGDWIIYIHFDDEKEEGEINTTLRYINEEYYVTDNPEYEEEFLRFLFLRKKYFDSYKTIEGTIEIYAQDGDLIIEWTEVDRRVKLFERMNNCLYTGLETRKRKKNVKFKVDKDEIGKKELIFYENPYGILQMDIYKKRKKIEEGGVR
jgi:hypothetical protein